MHLYQGFDTKCPLVSIERSYSLTTDQKAGGSNPPGHATTKRLGIADNGDSEAFFVCVGSARQAEDDL